MSVEDMRKVRWVNHGKDWPDGHRRCTKCKEVLPFEAFSKHSACLFGVNSICRECRKPMSKTQWDRWPLEKKILNRAKSRAIKKGLDFNIDLSDIVIPEICPILGTPIDTPSIDRIDSSKGYVKGNVMICSNRANVLKNNGSLDEFRKVVAFLERGVCEINL